jgi:hypothetical protein
MNDSDKIFENFRDMAILNFSFILMLNKLIVFKQMS